MKLHLCFLNYSVWSEVVNTYEAPKQFRYCEVCNSVDIRKVASTTNEVNLAMWNHEFEEN